jgi:hypothetical protein
MLNIAMTTFKKYIIEFIVIVAGVSVSFLAEQWRQNMNERREALELSNQAKDEARLLLSYEALRPYRNLAMQLKKIASDQAYAPDSLVVLISFMETDVRLDKYVTSIFKLAHNEFLRKEMVHPMQSLTGYFEMALECHQKKKQIIQEKLYPLLEQHRLMTDYVNFKTGGQLPTVETASDFNLFLADPHVLECLRRLILYVHQEEQLVLAQKRLLDEIVAKDLI